MWGWGSQIGNYFDASKITVLNRAIGGRSSRTFLTEGRWTNVLNELKPGDFVILQFGHNDGGGLTGNRGRGSLRGNGDETQTITNSAGQVEEVHSYGWYLRKYIADTRAKGATAIVVSQIPRNIWKDGKVGREAERYGGWARAAAEQDGPQSDRRRATHVNAAPRDRRARMVRVERACGMVVTPLAVRRAAVREAPSA